MKNATKVIFLLLAFVLPIGIFVFLKIFGRNEFDVPPLYVTQAPPQIAGCPSVGAAPYHVADSLLKRYRDAADSLTVVFFQPLSGEALNQLERVREQTSGDPVHLVEGELSGQNREVVRRCVFFLDGPANAVMIDKKGTIRGQYQIDDRDEADRLLTEITILLKKY